jgi:hypothetical protein
MMRRRLLLTLLVALTACLGSECSDSGSSHGAASTSFAAAANETERENPTAPPVPEPSAALVFGVGLLIAGAVTRRNR